jgi:uncharacterized protein (TIGR02001 family)
MKENIVMRKVFHSATLGAVLFYTILASTMAQAEVTGNVAVTNNYIWRGVTQTNDQAAVQGGLDYSSNIGLYAGTWLSNVDFSGTEQVSNIDGDDVGVASPDKGYELDLYGGYAGKIGGFGYDAGAIYYAYPTQTDIDFLELLLKGSYGPFSVGGYFTVDKEGTDNENDIYVVGNADFELDILKGIGLGFEVGHYEYDDSASEDYTHFGFNISKGTDFGKFSLGFAKNDLDGSLGDERVLVTWAHELTLLP